MSKYKCDRCGAPTDNDQSFTSRAFPGLPSKRYEVHRCDACDKRLDQELEWEAEGETLREDELVCPYCGASYEAEDAWRFEEGKTEEVECMFCGKKFDLEVEESRTYSTKRSLCEMPDDYGEEEEEDET